jgi:hypothetical protein
MHQDEVAPPVIAGQFWARLNPLALIFIREVRPLAERKEEDLDRDVYLVTEWSSGKTNAEDWGFEVFPTSSMRFLWNTQQVEGPPDFVLSIKRLPSGTAWILKNSRQVVFSVIRNDGVVFIVSDTEVKSEDAANLCLYATGPLGLLPSGGSPTQWERLSSGSTDPR